MDNLNLTPIKSSSWYSFSNLTYEIQAEEEKKKMLKQQRPNGNDSSSQNSLYRSKYMDEKPSAISYNRRSSGLFFQRRKSGGLLAQSNLKQQLKQEPSSNYKLKINGQVS